MSNKINTSRNPPGGDNLNSGTTSERISFGAYFKYGYVLVFVVCLIINFKYCFVGINNYILDIHGFRQTQTAISAFYTIADGFALDYMTPILGDPWKIPFEFPLYQWIVALVKMISPFSLDFCGRLVSLTFFYAMLYPCYKLLVTYTGSKLAPLLPLAFIVVHPIYIFWSRTFMIESTALCFSVCYVWQAVAYLENKKKVNFILASIAVLLAALVKITTVIPFIIFVAALVLKQWIEEKGYTFRVKTTIKYLLYALFFFVLPVVVIKLWVDYCDSLKALNTYANDLVSSAHLNNWNYGTLEEKTSMNTWVTILKNSSLYNPTFYFFTLALLGISVLLKLKYWKQAIYSLVLYILAPLIFTNLHFVHNYYTYSNSIFFCISLGFIGLSFLSDKRYILVIVGIVFCGLALPFMFKSYMKDYYKTQKTNVDSIVKVSEMVKKITDKDEVVMVYGNDWGCEYAYYMERKTIALRNTFKSVNDPLYKYIIKKHEHYKMRTLVFVTYFNLYDRDFLNEMVNSSGYKLVFQQEPFFIFQKSLNTD